MKCLNWKIKMEINTIKRSNFELLADYEYFVKFCQIKVDHYNLAASSIEEHALFYIIDYCLNPIYITERFCNFFECRHTPQDILANIDWLDVGRLGLLSSPIRYNISDFKNGLKNEWAYQLTTTHGTGIFMLNVIRNPTSKNIVGYYLSVAPVRYVSIPQLLYDAGITHIKTIPKKMTKRKCQKVFNEFLTDFQLMICYLMAHNYTNEKIADIINRLQPYRKTKTSRTSINKQVEKIRELFMMPSKEALIDLIISLTIDKPIPQFLINSLATELYGSHPRHKEMPEIDLKGNTPIFNIIQK